MIGAALGVLAVVFAIATLTPSAADAFVGESLVLNPAKTDLTTPAKTIISKPTFLPANVGEAAAAGGAAEASAAAGVYEAAGLLPALGGSVLAFTAGVGIGTEICNVIGIEGCWSFDSTGANPAIAGKGTWKFSNSPACSGGPSFAWYAETEGGTTCSVFWRGQFGLKTSSPCGNTIPGPPNIVGETGSGSECGLEEGYKFGKGWAARYAMSNRALNYNATNDPAKSDFKYTAPSKWSENLAGQLKGHEADSAGKVGQRIANAIEGSKVANPYGGKVPSCDGDTKTECLVKIEELDLKPDVQELDWDDAVIEELDELEPERTREEEAERVIELEPPPGTFIGTESEITVVTNPSEEDMPKWVPKPPPDGEDEDAEEFKKRRRLIPPLWLPSVDELDDGSLDPDKGPGAVVTTTPKPNFDSDPGGEPDGRLDPHTETEIKVWTNPETASEPGSYGTGAPGGFTPPTVPAIDMDPLSGLSPCGVFPFGLFCWVGEAFAQFNTSGTCPNFSTPVADTGSNFAVTLCGETAETIMGYLRPAILLAFTVGLGFLFARGTKAIGGD